LWGRAREGVTALGLRVKPLSPTLSHKGRGSSPPLC
jgi:hypothetical protein